MGHLSVEGEIILKEIRNIGWDGVDWINLGRNKKKWWDLWVSLFTELSRCQTSKQQLDKC